MTEKEKINILEANGWHQYYSKTHWVHKDIKLFLERVRRLYWGMSDYTNYQMNTDEAYDLYLKCENSKKISTLDQSQ